MGILNGLWEWLTSLGPNGGTASGQGDQGHGIDPNG
jgi:hypothetical protein